MTEPGSRGDAPTLAALVTAAASLLILSACGNSVTSPWITGGVGGSDGDDSDATTSGSATSAASTTAAASTSAGGGDCLAKPDTETCRSCCAVEHPAGFQALLSLISKSCGCDAGEICESACASEAYCDEPGGLPSSGSPCESCINGLAGTEGCALGAIPECQTDAECDDALTCILTCP